MITCTGNYYVKLQLFSSFTLGIMLLYSSGIEFSKILTNQNLLVQLTGTFQNCNIYISSNTSSSKFGYKSTSQKAELIFYLLEHKKKFEIFENVGDNDVEENITN